MINSAIDSSISAQTGAHAQPFVQMLLIRCEERSRGHVTQRSHSSMLVSNQWFWCTYDRCLLNEARERIWLALQRHGAKQQDQYRNRRKAVDVIPLQKIYCFVNITSLSIRRQWHNSIQCLHRHFSTLRTDKLLCPSPLCFRWNIGPTFFHLAFCEACVFRKRYCLVVMETGWIARKFECLSCCCLHYTSSFQMPPVAHLEQFASEHDQRFSYCLKF